MVCRLIIRMLEGGQGRVVSECEYREGRVAIGRGTSNDIVLHDPRRLVSAKHAELRATGAAWVLLDVGSTNGTLLNGVRVAPFQECALRDGDSIVLGSYEIEYRAVQTERGGQVSSHSLPPAPQSLPPTAEEHERILYLTRRMVGDREWSSPEELSEALEICICRGVAGYEVQKVKTLLRDVKAAVGTGSYGGLLMAIPSAESCRQDGLEKRSGRSEALYSPAGRSDLISGKSQSVDSNAVVRASGGHEARVLDAMCAGLADAIRGRREFQREFEVDVTRVLAWAPNALKQAESAAEIRAVLLNPESRGLTRDQVIADLMEVFHDLTFHQLGLLAGFRECIRGLLRELDPQKIAEPGKGGASGIGGGLLAGRNLKADAAAWKQYLETYRRLTEEEVKVFERILAPYFAAGYLSIHQSRHPSA